MRKRTWNWKGQTTLLLCYRERQNIGQQVASGKWRNDRLQSGRDGGQTFRR